MRSILTFITLLFLLSTGVSAANWQVLDFPVKDNLNGLYFTAPDSGYIVTGFGHIARTVDGGVNWVRMFTKDNNSIEDVDFNDFNNGIVCGRYGLLLQTKDAGVTWENISPADSTIWFFDIEMIDSDTGLVVGMHDDGTQSMLGIAYRTVDGGKTWKELEPMGSGYSEIFYQKGYPLALLSYGRIHYSADKGKNWKPYLTVENAPPGRAFSYNGKTAIMCGPSGMVAFSNNYGKTWRNLTINQDIVFIAAQLVDENHGFIGGYKNMLFETKDGGLSWDPIAMKKLFDIMDFFYIGNKLYACGSNSGLMVTTIE